jgi:DNA-binding transcriptional MerR regulator
MKKYYSIADIARELNLPESTVRYYRDRFKNYVPATRKGGRKFYDQEALAALRMAAESLRNGETAEAVKEQLALHFGEIIDSKELAAAGQQQPSFNREDFKQLVDTMKELNQSILSLTEKIEEQKKPSLWDRITGKK